MAKKITLQEALNRIVALEDRVRELESRPAQVIHYHYPREPYPQPIIGPCWNWPGYTITSSAT